MARHSFSVPREQHSGHRSVSGGLARAAVFGISDGLVSNVSLMIGLAGSGVDSNVVRLAGIAGAIAGAASMAAGEWVSVSAQNELITREIDIERRELNVNAAAETIELAKIYESHGIEPERAAAAAADVMRRPESALAVHAREELGVDPGVLPSAWKAATLSLICFIFGALLPVVPWYIGSGSGAKFASVAIGVVAAAFVGAIIGRSAEKKVWWSSLRQVLILIVACGVTYLIGSLFDVAIN
ncbi:MAG: VIT1/CCC1 transporter family protein [Acidimicrobiia bacterium]